MCSLEIRSLPRVTPEPGIKYSAKFPAIFPVELLELQPECLSAYSPKTMFIRGKVCLHLVTDF